MNSFSEKPKDWGYQRRINQRLRESKVRALFIKYGAGKGLVTLRHARDSYLGGYRDDRTYHMPLVVVCLPRNIPTWQREIAKWWPNDANIYIGVKGLQALLEDFWTEEQESILLMPHHRLATHFEEMLLLFQRMRPACFAVDESTCIKNPKAKITKAALALARQHEGEKLVLSGKPMPEGPQEIWSQFQFVYGDANPYGPTYYHFLRRWFIKTNYSWALRLDLETEFYDIYNTWSIELKGKDLAEFEKKKGVHHTQYVMEYFDQTKQQKDLLTYLYENWALPAEDTAAGQLGLFGQNDIEYSHTIALAMKAQQIASGFYYGTNKRPIQLAKQPKLELLKEVLVHLFTEDPHRQIIIWHAFQAETEMIYNAIEPLYTVCIGPDELNIAAFHHKEFGVIIMPCGVSSGFNELVGADVNIWYSNIWSQEKRDQGEARINRPGQKRSVVTNIDLVCPDMMDMELASGLQGKNMTPDRLATVVNKYAKKQATHSSTNSARNKQ